MHRASLSGWRRLLGNSEWRVASGEWGFHSPLAIRHLPSLII
jgi:hypothetical protein